MGGALADAGALGPEYLKAVSLFCLVSRKVVRDRRILKRQFWGILEVYYKAKALVMLANNGASGNVS